MNGHILVYRTHRVLYDTAVVLFVPVVFYMTAIEPKRRENL